MMHIWGRLSRVMMACALSVLFLGGVPEKRFGLLRRFPLPILLGARSSWINSQDVRRRKLHRQFFDGRRSGESG